jgi:uncharacterized coiled-coil DUF342 family protein
MKRRIAGFLVAIVAVVTGVFVLLRAEKPRRYLQARYKQVRDALPESKQVRQSARRIANRVSHLANDARGTTKQAINKVKHTGSDLAEKAKQLTATGNRNGR